MSWWAISTTFQSLEQAIHICFQMLSPNVSPVTHFSPLSAGSNTAEKGAAGNGTQGREVLTRGANFSQSLPILSTVMLTTITSDEVFDHLLDGSKGAVDVNDLVQSARGSFRQIEMWYAEESTWVHLHTAMTFVLIPIQSWSFGSCLRHKRNERRG
jgi:hypothetical protein